jgi:hypothetical protein
MKSISPSKREIGVTDRESSKASHNRTGRSCRSGRRHSGRRPGRKAKSAPSCVVFGNLVSFDQNGAVVGTPNGNVNINFTANTDYYPNNQAAAVAGFKVGDQVLARGYFRNGFWTATIRYDLVPSAIYTRKDGMISP